MNMKNIVNYYNTAAELIFLSFHMALKRFIIFKQLQLLIILKI